MNRTLADDDNRTPRALTRAERRGVAAVAAMVGGIGAIGFVNSFARVAVASRPSFGALAPTVPLGIDLGIAAFSALDLVLARLEMRPPWVRLIPWALTAATIYLNVAGPDTLIGRVAHGTFPALWVVAVEIGTHVVRVRAGLASGTRMDRIRISRWVLAPVRTAALWRRMILWEERSYPAALRREQARLLALTDLQDDHGAIAWRWKADRRARTLYRLGQHPQAAPEVHPGPALAALEAHPECAPGVNPSASGVHPECAPECTPSAPGVRTPSAPAPALRVHPESSADRTPSAPELHPECTPSAPEVNPDRTPSAPRTRTRTALRVHSDRTPSAHPSAPDRTPSAPGVRTPGATPGDAETEFMAVLAAGQVPSQREIRTRLRVGQDRARQLQEHLATVAGGGSPAIRIPEIPEADSRDGAS